MKAARPFTPTREDPRDLDARTVGAESGAAIDRIAARIDAAIGGNLAHTLVVGPRGAGKTHALAVAQERSDALHEPGAAVAVVVPEDAHGIVTYAELLGVVARALGVRLDARPPGDVGQVEARLGEALGPRVLVLVVENLDRLFAKLGPAGQHDLRSWVETSRRVLVLASTPMLFDAVSRREGPWFGSFVVEPLGDLTAEDGTELLTHLRVDDPELVPYLATESGAARVQALHALTGGSPRLWTIFADVVTVELLDELVPAVERLLEELVTYYQQRLWDLGPNEERIIIALGTGAVSQTATALAHDLGLDRNTVGTTLGRLEDSRWVRGTKLKGTDQRSTWYELREPLLRHYLQYRNESTSELTLVVEMLRHWFDPGALESHLLSVGPGSVAERYVGTALGLVRPAGYDDGYRRRSPRNLLLQARRWITDPAAPVGFADAGVVVEAVLARAGMGTARPCPARLRAVVAAVDDEMDLSVTTVGRGLDAVAEAATGAAADVLAWLAAAWIIPSAPVEARARLVALADRLTAPDDLIGLHVAHDLAYIRGLADPGGAVSLMAEVGARRSALQGPGHPDTLRARSNCASFLGDSGDGVAALATYREVADDAARVLGAEDPLTLTSRHQVAYHLGEMGDAVGAREAYREVVADAVRALGAEDPITLRSRYGLAFYLGRTGDAVGARAAFQGIVEASARVLGADDLLTLQSRYGLALYQGETGDAAGALAAFREVAEDVARVLGADDQLTLLARDQVAYHLGQTGDVVGALAAFREVAEDAMRVMGAEDPITLASQHQVAFYLGRTGARKGALALLREVVAIRARVLGADDPATLASRHQVAYLQGETGDVVGALAAFREVAEARTQTLGADDPNTLLSRYSLAFYEYTNGDPVAALVTAMSVVGAASAAGWPPELERATTKVLAVAVTDVIRQGLVGEVPEALRRDALGRLLEAAEGSEVALAQVPAEVRALVRHMADRSEGASDEA